VHFLFQLCNFLAEVVLVVRGAGLVSVGAVELVHWNATLSSICVIRRCILRA
jgi:hypothetical protein